MRKSWIGLGVVALLAAFLGGFWPQWQKRRAAERECATVLTRLAENERQLQICRLNGHVFSAATAAQAHNFGIAEQHVQGLLSGLDALASTADPAVRPLIERARARASEMREAARRIDASAVEDVGRAASDLGALLTEIEKAQADAAQTALAGSTR